MRTGFIATRGANVFVPLVTGRAIVGRTVGDVVLSGRLALEAPDVDELSDWSFAYDSAEPGLIEPAGAAVRIGGNPAFQDIEAKAHAWMEAQNLSGAFQQARVTPLVCQGATFHTDANAFGDFVFCVVWLGDDVGLELLFPNIEERIRLAYGTIILFDPAQPHGVVCKGNSSWDARMYLEQVANPTQHFVSFDLSATDSEVGARLGISVIRDTSGLGGTTTLSIQGHPAKVDPTTGAWKVQ